MLIRLLILALLAPALFACSPTPAVMPTSPPTSVEATATYELLRNLPAPSNPVPVAVYGYPDLTGQFKPTETVSTSSRAVTQGAVWMLVKALKDASSGRWFKVIQRANLDYLLKERQIIRETRGRVAEQTGQAQPGLPSLLFAGVILDGGIIGYDSNTVTGGLGARYLGIGGDVQYRQDTVTVYLNAISSQTGEILKSVMTRKTVASYGVRGSIFKFVAFQKLLEGEAGFTVNEPGQIALAQAIEHAVRSLIIEGALEGLWQFEDRAAGQVEAQLYLSDKEEDLMLAASTEGPGQALLTEKQLDRLLARRKARRERLTAQASEQRLKLAATQRQAPAASLPAAGAPPDRQISAAGLDALMQLLAPFNAETRRLRQRRQALFEEPFLPNRVETA
ncbi:MAG: CsgG/HfaB family protein [Geminicoccaceae bacterium]